MNSNPPAEEAPAAGCFAECPHFEQVTGACTHECNQTLIQQFVEHPGTNCSVYTKWKAEQMAALAQRLKAYDSNNFIK